MKRLVAVIAVAFVLFVLTACTPPAAIAPPIPEPIKNIIGQVIHDIWWSTKPIPPVGKGGPPIPHSCAIQVDIGDAKRNNYAAYRVLDRLLASDAGGGFYLECIIPARLTGRALPVVKVTGDPNDTSQVPAIEYRLSGMPLFGTGPGHFVSADGSNVAVYRKGYIQALPDDVA